MLRHWYYAHICIKYNFTSFSICFFALFSVCFFAIIMINAHIWYRHMIPDTVSRNYIATYLVSQLAWTFKFRSTLITANQRDMTQVYQQGDTAPRLLPLSIHKGHKSIASPWCAQTGISWHTCLGLRMSRYLNSSFIVFSRIINDYIK